MLTAKQELFVQGVVLEGMTYSDAYRAAYNTERMTDKTVNEKACLLAGEDKIRARMDELRGELLTPKVMTAQQRLEYLTRIVNGTEKEIIPQIVGGEVIEIEAPTAVKTRLNALDIMNKMTGEYVQKVEANVTNEVTINVELVDD